MVGPAPDFDPAKLSEFLNELTSVSFQYRNGTNVTFTGDALTGWVTAYKTLILVQAAVLKSAKQQQEATGQPPTTLADQLKKRG